MSDPYPGRGVRVPTEMRDSIQDMIRAGVTVPNLLNYVEYVAGWAGQTFPYTDGGRFLSSWRAGDYPSSFDNLHRYFDHTIRERDRPSYQYALLNLALLHADFGCPSEALTAIEETIATARENNDMACLNYSLSWLYHFGKVHPKWMKEVRRRGLLGPDREALALLKSKAKATQMWSLLSTSLLSEAKITLANGESVSSAFASVLKASQINLTQHVRSVVGSQMMMQSFLFARLGVSCQSAMIGDIFLQCHGPDAPIEDVLRATCNKADMLAEKGKFEEAVDLMESVDPENLRNIGHGSLWTTQLGLLKLQQYLYQSATTPSSPFRTQTQQANVKS